MATVPSTPRTKSYTLAADSAGPFSIGYRIFDTVSVNVYVDGILQSGWTVQATFTNGYDDNATVTPPSTVYSSSVVRIETWMETGRGADFVPGDPSLTGNLNNDVARAWALLGDHDRELRRTTRTFIDADPLTLTPNTFLLVDANGKIVTGPASVSLATAPSYGTPTAIAAASDLVSGQVVLSEKGTLNKEEWFQIVPYATYAAGDGVLVFATNTPDPADPAHMLWAKSFRTEYASFEEAKADLRALTSGYWSMAFGAGGQYVTTGDNWGQTTTGGSKLKVEWGDFRAWGAVGDNTANDSAALNLATASGLTVIGGAGLSYKIDSSVTVAANQTIRDFIFTHGTAGMNGVLANSGSKIEGKIVGTGTTNIIERGVYPAVDGASDVLLDLDVSNMTVGVEAQPITTAVPARSKGRVYVHDMVGAVGVSEGYGVLLSPARQCQIDIEGYNIPRHAIYLSAGAELNQIRAIVEKCYNFALQIYSTAAETASTANTIWLKVKDPQQNVAANSGAFVIVGNAHRNTIYLSVEGNGVAYYAGLVQGASGGLYPLKNHIICEGVTGQFLGPDVIRCENADMTIVEGTIDAYAVNDVVAARTAGTNGSSCGGIFSDLAIDAQGQSISGVYSEVTTVPTIIEKSRIVNNGTGARVYDGTSGQRQGYTRRVRATGTTGSIGASGGYLDVTVALPDSIAIAGRTTHVEINSHSVDYANPITWTVFGAASETTALIRFTNNSASPQTVDYTVTIEGD